MAFLLGAKRRTVRRYERREENGVIVREEIDRFEVSCSIQPMSPRELRQFIEGDRVLSERAWWMGVQPGVELQFTGFDPDEDIEFEPDEVEYRDRLLVVRGDEDWADLGPFPNQYRAYILTESASEVGRFKDA